MDKPSPGKRSQAKPYSEETIKTCIQNIKSGKMSAYGAGKAFGIPMSTIRYRMSNRWKQSTRPGPSTVLSTSEEQEIVSWMIGMKERGFPVSRANVLAKVSECMSSNPDREKWFKNNRPGRKWVELFIRRNPDCHCFMKASEPVLTASEEHTRGWFQSVESWLTKNGMRDLLEDPRRIFIGDELSFSFPPETKELCPRSCSSKTLEIERAADVDNIAIMFSFCASGVAVPPNVVLPDQRNRAELTKDIPLGWGLDVSRHGWLNPASFRQYIVKVFHPFLVKQGVKFPIIYFVNGHALNKVDTVDDLCRSLGIVLVSLYLVSNTPQLTQPANIGIVELLKGEWQNITEEWHVEHPGKLLTLPYLFPVLDKTLKRGIHASTIQNGFRLCGLHPFNVNAVDYSTQSAVQKTHAQPIKGSLPDESEVPYDEWEQMEMPEPEVSLAPEHVAIPIDKIYEAYDLIGGSTINRIEGDITGLTREERIIRFFYREFVRPHVHFNGHFMSNDSNNATQVSADDDDGGEHFPASRVLDINDYENIKLEQQDSGDEESSTSPPADDSKANIIEPMRDSSEGSHLDINSDFGHFFA